MSGPKGGAYRVETAEQREARMLRDAMARYARAQSLWQAAQTRMATTSAAIGEQVNYAAPHPVPVSADSAAYDRAAQEWESAAATAVEVAAAAREKFADTRYAAQVARIAAAVAAVESATTPSRTVRADAGTQHENQRSAASPVERTIERVRRRLEELAAFDHDAERVQVLVGDIAEAQSESRVDLLVSELDIILAEVRDAAKRVGAIEAARAQLAGLSARIAEINSATADSVRRRIASLMAVQADVVPAEIATAVEKLVDDVDAEADRQHVIGAMRRALGQLGYALGPEFANDLGGPEGTAFAGGPTPGYGVKVRLEPGDSRFSAQAVKSEAVLTSADEDLAAERQFCADFNELIELAKDDGVVLDVDIALEPGEYAVQQVPASELADSATGRAAKRTKPREMRRR